MPFEENANNESTTKVKQSSLLKDPEYGFEGGKVTFRHQSSFINDQKQVVDVPPAFVISEGKKGVAITTQKGVEALIKIS